MSDSDNEDIFDSVVSGTYHVKSSASKKACADSDNELEALAAEVSAVDVAKLTEEIAKWEAVRTKARSQKIDTARITKVDRKIKELRDELSVATQTTASQDREIQRLERELQDLETERAAIELKITAKAARLRQLKPHSTSEDWLNDPSQLGGRVMNGKFVEDQDVGEDDYQQLSSMMAERRRAAQAAGQYNSESGHVKIKNPAYTRDVNAGF